MAIVLRDAHDADLPAIARIQRLCFFGEPTDPRRLGDVTYTVAEVDGVVAGYCISSLRLSPSRVIVLSLGVHPEYRRIGVATQLLEAVQCAGVICDRPVRVIAGASNRVFGYVLHSVGFRITEQQRDIRAYEWGGDDDGQRKALVRRLSADCARRSLPR